MRAHRVRGTRAHARPRRGVVLVAVMALLTLGTALIAGAFAAARASARAARSTRAAVVAHAAARRALVHTVSTWSAAYDSMNIGAYDVREERDAGSTPLDATDTRVRVHRLSPTLFLVAAEASVLSARAPIARRRVRVLLERAPTIDTAVVSRARPIARWASGDLY